MSKKKSITILTVIGIFIILMTVFAVVSFPIGKSVYDYNGYVKTISLGMDLSGGIEAVYKVNDDGLGNLDQRVSGTVDSLQSLLISKGYTEATVSSSNTGNTRFITVQVPDVDNPERLLSLVGRPASLEFRSAQSDNPSEYEVLITGKEHLSSAYVVADENNGSKYAVGLQFNDAGTKKFAQVTEDYLNKNTYIYVNDEYYTTVSVNSTITNGRAVISSSNGYDYEEAYEFATKLQSGTFGVDLTVYSQSLISATLGDEAIKWALIAGGIGILCIFVFMAVTYRLLGIAADIALAAYIVILLWLCAVLPWVQLTLAGIAGILLSIGMAVDANVVIFERIRDEYKNSNKPIPSAVKEGFKRSSGAIIDGNVTTIIGAVVLWIVGATTSTSIVGFAVTLFIGIILSMFTALVVTRLLIKCILPFNSTNEKLYALKRAKDETENTADIADDKKTGEVEA